MAEKKTDAADELGAKIEAATDKFDAKIEAWADKNWGKRNVKVKTGGGFFYFLGFLGSAIYFIGLASDFWAGVLGVLKSIVWPAFLVYEALGAVGA